MSVDFWNTDISDASLGNTYDRGFAYKLASYSAGWTLTGIDVTGLLNTEVASVATNTNPWTSPPIEWPIMAGLCSGATGFTPVKPNDADMQNSQWLNLENIVTGGVTFEVENGSSQIGSTFLIPYRLRFRCQIRLLVGTDFYLYIWNQNPSATTFTFQGNSTVWVS